MSGGHVIGLLHGAALPGELWGAWTLSPLVTAPLLALGGAYAAGQRRYLMRRGARPPYARIFWAGYGVLVVALVSPVDALGEALFSAHMVQHMLLVLVAAPLLVLGRPVEVSLWALSARRRRAVHDRWTRTGARRAFGGLSWGPTAWTLHATALWVWHLPLLYEAALHSELVHAVEHASFLGTAMIFWWTPVSAASRGRRGHPAAILLVFTTALQAGALGALITFAEIAWYPAHETGTEAWGVSPLVDQQLAGIIMWLPGGLVYLAAVGALLVGLLRGAEARARAREDGTRHVGETVGRSLLTVALLASAVSCELPRDPERTLAQARGDTLVVGAVDAPPHLVRTSDGARGAEAELVHAFARRIDAAIVWRWGSLDHQMHALQRFELDLLAAGLTRASPWASKVGITRPWRVEADAEHVLAVPPGENAMLVALDRVIEERRSETR